MIAIILPLIVFWALAVALCRTRYFKFVVIFVLTYFIILISLNVYVIFFVPIEI